MFLYSSGSRREASILGWSSSPGNCSQMQTPRPAESETRAVPSTACFTWPPRGLQCLPWCARCQSVLEIQSVSQSLRKIDLRENGASEEKQDLTIASCYPQFHSNFSRARICSIVPLMGLRPHATVWDLLFSCRHLCPAGVRKCVAKDVKGEHLWGIRAGERNLGAAGTPGGGGVSCVDMNFSSVSSPAVGATWALVPSTSRSSAS